jgi:hypothetical protein
MVVLRPDNRIWYTKQVLLSSNRNVRCRIFLSNQILAGNTVDIPCKMMSVTGTSLIRLLDRTEVLRTWEHACLIHIGFILLLLLNEVLFCIKDKMND